MLLSFIYPTQNANLIRKLVARKATVLERTRGDLNLPCAETMAIGDGANDSLMIEAAGLGIGYRPKRALAEVADAILAHHSLDALLWVLGIPQAEWLDNG